MKLIRLFAIYLLRLLNVFYLFKNLNLFYIFVIFLFCCKLKTQTRSQFRPDTLRPYLSFPSEPDSLQDTLRLVTRNFSYYCETVYMYVLSKAVVLFKSAFYLDLTFI